MTGNHQHLKCVALVLAASVFNAGCMSSINRTLTHVEAEESYYQGDFARSFRLTEAMAYQGDKKAEYTLGYFYYYGIGAPQNRPLGISWMRESARKGFEPAITALKALHRPPVPTALSMTTPTPEAGTALAIASETKATAAIEKPNEVAHVTKTAPSDTPKAQLAYKDSAIPQLAIATVSHIPTLIADANMPVQTETTDLKPHAKEPATTLARVTHPQKSPTDGIFSIALTKKTPQAKPKRTINPLKARVQSAFAWLNRGTPVKQKSPHAVSTQAAQEAKPTILQKPADLQKPAEPTTTIAAEAIAPVPAEKPISPIPKAKIFAPMPEETALAPKAEETDFAPKSKETALAPMDPPKIFQPVASKPASIAPNAEMKIDKAADRLPTYSHQWDTVQLQQYKKDPRFTADSNANLPKPKKHARHAQKAPDWQEAFFDSVDSSKLSEIT